MLGEKHGRCEAMARHKRTKDQRSGFVLIWEREGIEIARERVLALDADDALSDEMGLSAKHGIDLFDKSIHCRVGAIDA
jgi:hypothetical protein